MSIPKSARELIRLAFTFTFFLLVSWAGFFQVTSSLAAFSLGPTPGPSSSPTPRPSNSPMHWSGDKTLWDRKTNIVNLIGHGAIHQWNESLFADKITIELDTKIVHAYGNATYVNETAMIQGVEMHFNLETRTGTVVAGRLSTNSITLSGDRINKLGENRYQVYRGEYSTCKDCPQSWTLSAANVDMEMEHYAYLSNVIVKIADAPAMWIPYLVVPIKTKRQTGLLIPSLGFSNGGFTFLQPFFWAINRSFDATLGLGHYWGRGRRFEAEGRYALTDGKAVGNFYQLNDSTFRDYLTSLNLPASRITNSRWAMKVNQQQTLPFGVEEKLRINDVSDSLYPSRIGNVGINGEAYLTSDLSLTHATDKVSTIVSMRRYRDLIFSDPDPQRFNPNTVQIAPQATMTTNDKLLFGGVLASGLSVGVTDFSRSAGPFDRDHTAGAAIPGVPADGSYRLGQDPLRKATRFVIDPSIYTSYRPWDVVTWVPSVEYKQYFYSFHNAAPELTRGYLQIQQNISMQFERIYDLKDPKIPKLKHLIRPELNYSVIPYFQQPDHPFQRQMDFATANNFTGYNFDNDDIIPRDASVSNTNYQTPQGNGLAYGFTTQLIRKRVGKQTPSLLAAPSPTNNASSGAASLMSPAPSFQPVSVDDNSYQTIAEWSAGQSYNFRELHKTAPGQNPQPLSRFYSLMSTSFDHWSSFLNYYYIPYQPVNDDTSRHVYTTGLTYTFEKAMKQRILAFERSFTFSYVHDRSTSQSQTVGIQGSMKYSLSDYILPSFSLAYDMLASRWQSAITGLTFQSPSECWKLDLLYAQGVCPAQTSASPNSVSWCGSFSFNLSLNLTGSGYGSINEASKLATPASSPPPPPDQSPGWGT